MGGCTQTYLAFISDPQNCENYLETIRNHLLSVGENLGGEVWIFNMTALQLMPLTQHHSGLARKWYRVEQVRT